AHGMAARRRIDLDRGAQHGRAFIPLAKLHQAMPKIEERTRMGRLPRQDLAIVPDGTRELTLIEKCSCKTKKRLRMTRHLPQHAREHRLRVRGFPAIETDRTQEHIEIRHWRRELLSAPQYGFCIGEPTHLAIGRSKLLERRSKYRVTRRGALEPCERLSHSPR